MSKIWNVPGMVSLPCSFAGRGRPCVALVSWWGEGNREGNREDNEGNLERVFNAIKSNPHATIAELENVLGVSHATVERAQKSLQEAGRIRRVGGTRGHWEVLETWNLVEDQGMSIRIKHFRRFKSIFVTLMFVMIASVSPRTAWATEPTNVIFIYLPSFQIYSVNSVFSLAQLHSVVN